MKSNEACRRRISLLIGFPQWGSLDFYSLHLPRNPIRNSLYAFVVSVVGGVDKREIGFDLFSKDDKSAAVTASFENVSVTSPKFRLIQSSLLAKACCLALSGNISYL